MIRIIPLLAVVTIFAQCGKEKQIQSVRPRPVATGNRITIHCTQTSSYCGGARPSEEMLKELQTPKPQANQLWFVRSGTTNRIKETPITSGTTDAQGNLNIRLEPGVYCLVDPNKVDSAMYKAYLLKYGEPTPNYNAINKSCLEDWLKTPALVFEVLKGDTAQVFSVESNIPCSYHSVPCADFKGPYPP